MSCEDSARDTLPVAGDEQRPLRNARRPITCWCRESALPTRLVYTRGDRERRAVAALSANSRETICRIEDET